ncbi:hypothetical protein CALVIDRAFT_539356 [Calocera viscosa TUFC12733]|uniref:Uncharacterized protein n=1 Tax=Calocera viscosa (strain TUFC12733) TaxID=1330018 RepID=A0A167JW65_CALVF|nr:hypothetical protein CALVIDRAFT_539356 [Calocera viscosa TUFC12733]
MTWESLRLRFWGRRRLALLRTLGITSVMVTIALTDGPPALSSLPDVMGRTCPGFRLGAGRGAEEMSVNIHNT